MREASIRRYLALGIAALALTGLVGPTLAHGQQATTKATLTATPRSGFPDRTYILQLPPLAAMPKPGVTENGGPVVNLAISASGGRASGTYVVSYRSLLPPDRRALVRATIAGFPAATASYTTPALDSTASESSVRRWVDSPYLTVFVIVAILALTAAQLVTNLRHRY
jgi:hypothetical protein